MFRIQGTLWSYRAVISETSMAFSTQWVRNAGNKSDPFACHVAQGDLSYRSQQPWEDMDYLCVSLFAWDCMCLCIWVCVSEWEWWWVSVSMCGAIFIYLRELWYLKWVKGGSPQYPAIAVERHTKRQQETPKDYGRGIKRWSDAKGATRKLSSYYLSYVLNQVTIMVWSGV